MKNLTIDPEFQALIPPLAPEELAQLEANIIKDGCRDPLVVWQGTLIDGHNRHDICTRHGIEFETVVMEFETRAHVRIWMRDNQKGRRNLSHAWLIEMQLGNKADLLEIGGDAMREKKKGNTNASKTTLSQNDKVVLPPVNTQKEIAKAAGVSTGQVGMAEQVKKKSPELWEKAKAGEVSISAAYKAVNTHVGQNSGENEWYTPERFITAARAAMGSIDLDPASSEIANKTVNASRFYTKDNDGLNQKWEGNIWMNPPYAQPLMGQFAEAVTAKFDSGEIQQAIILVNNATETAWFARMASAASAICFPSSRIKFIDQQGNPSGSPLQGQAILYMGKDRKSFAQNFSPFGFVCHVI